jgi:hypothetical protein
VWLEASVVLGARERCARLYPRFDGLTGLQTPRRYEFYNAARILGDAARLLEKPASVAMGHYQRSLDWATKLRFRPEIALSRLGIAEVLLEGTVEEQAEAQGHLDFAIDELRAMKMQPSLERALRHKGLLHA